MTAKLIWCAEHPSYSVIQSPTKDCLTCLEAFERKKMRIRVGELKNGHKRGEALGGRGTCSLCKIDDKRLTSKEMFSLPSGGKICEYCYSRFESADSRASSRASIRQDMVEFDVPIYGLI